MKCSSASRATFTCRFLSFVGTASNKRARVLVVGSGRMGRIRASLVSSSPRFELCGIVDPIQNHAKSLAERFGVNAFVSLQDAINESSSESSLDGLIVCSPTFTHESVIRIAGEKQLSVFTEKPVDETAEKIESIFRYAAEKRIQLCCGFQRRFDPSYVVATEALKNGSIGSPVMASIFFADHPVPPKEFLLTGGNIFMDLSAHDIDYITHTLQDEVVSVYATGTSSDQELAAAGVHDNATIVMNFSKGAVVTLFMSRSAVYGYDQRCDIFGTEGLLSIKNIHENSMELSNRTGVHRARLHHSFPQRFHQAFEREIDAFANSILLGTEWPVSGEQCVRVQRVADAARKSAETGRVVSILPDC